MPCGLSNPLPLDIEKFDRIGFMVIEVGVIKPYTPMYS